MLFGPVQINLTSMHSVNCALHTGMEGAIDAMHTGEVDLYWAKEHHNLWVEEEQQKIKDSPSPAE